MIRSLVLLLFMSALMLSADELRQVRKLGDLAERSPERLTKYLEELGKENAELYINLKYNRATALFRAIDANRPQNVKLLLQYGADVSVSSGIPSATTMSSMLKHIIDPYGKTNQRIITPAGPVNYRVMERYMFKPVAFLARTRIPEPDRDLELQILRMLLEAGADPNAPDPVNGWPPVLFYFDRGFEEALELLLEYGPDLSSPLLKKKVRIGGTERSARILREAMNNPRRPRKSGSVDLQLLYSSMENKNTAVYRKLLDQIKNINSFLDSEFNTPLMYAVRSGNPDAVRDVLARNPALELKNSDRMDAILLAVQRNDNVIYNLLVQAGAKVTPSATLEEAVLQRREDQLKRLILKVTPDKRAPAAREALLLSAKRNDLKCFQCLMKHSRFNFFTAYGTGKNKFPPLIFSLFDNASKEIVAISLSDKFPANLRDTETGKTLLGYLAASGSGATAEITKMLLEAGADPNAGDRNGVTPLMTAAENGDAETVRLLLKANASKTKKDNSGMTALSYAKNAGNPEVLRLLK